MCDEIQTLVIDNGSFMCKAGFATEEAPRTIVKSIIGSFKFGNSSIFFGDEDIFFGDDACKKSSSLILKYPIEHGIVKNWDDMEKIFHYVLYDELRVDPEEHPILLTEAIFNPKTNREKMIQLMFETFNVPSFYIGIQSLFSLYSSHRKTGMVLEIGDGVSQFVPIYEGELMKHSILRLNLGGRDLTNYLQKLLNYNGYINDLPYQNYQFVTSCEKQIAHDIKEKLSYVAFDFDAEKQKANSSYENYVAYILPDGRAITLNNEHFYCPELLFKPYLNGFDYDGIDKTLFDSIMLCNENIRQDLCSNIVLAGGTTMIKGLSERIEKEITNLVPPNMRINIISHPDRINSSWIGASIFASDALFPHKVILHDEYNEYGPKIVRRKCY